MMHTLRRGAESFFAIGLVLNATLLPISPSACGFQAFCNVLHSRMWQPHRPSSI